MASSDPSPAASARSSVEGSDPSGMVERVARAIGDAIAAMPDYLDGRFPYEAAAIAAIKAMREPTEAMVKASAPAFKEVSDMVVFCHARGSHPGGLKKDPVPDAWRAMIDAALADEASEPQPHDQQSAGDKSREDHS